MHKQTLLSEARRRSDKKNVYLWKSKDFAVFDTISQPAGNKTLRE